MKIRVSIIMMFVLGCILLAFPTPAAATPPNH